MKRLRGFTLIEVSLFLAITGLIFLGVAIGVQNSIANQRNNDAVQSFADFLRSAYNGVSNVQNGEGMGNSEKAIYGKLITFGETRNLFGADNSDNAIFSYNVIGEIKDGVSNNTLESLRELNANVFDGDRLAGLAEGYTPKWSSVIQSAEYNPYIGALLIVRNPSSGTIFTFVMEGETIQVNSSPASNPLKDYLTDEHFKIEKADYCLNPDAGAQYDRRFDIRIVKNARNSSGVMVISPENGSYACSAS